MRRLDGIPLAIELAAARVNMLSPRQLRGRLEERFRVLTSGNRDLPRHRTLRALIDWSHDLLDERERAILRSLGIFVNGFTLEGAIAVGADDDTGECDVFDSLALLVDQSLVIAEPAGDSLRYRLLQSTREYMLEKIVAAGEHELLADRHLTYLRVRFAALRREAEQTARLTDLEDALLHEFEDVRTALNGALSRGAVRAGGELLAEIGVVWRYIGTAGAGVQHLEGYVAALPETESLLLAQLSSALSFLLDILCLHGRALEVAERAVAYARKSGARAALAFALSNCAFPKLRLGRVDEVRAELSEAEAIQETTPFVRLALLNRRSLFYRYSGDVEHELRCRERLSRQYRAVGNVLDELSIANGLAELEYTCGNTQRAVALAREILATLRPRDGSRSHGVVLQNLAGYLCAIDDLQEAEKAARAALHLLADTYANEGNVAYVIEHLALVRALHGELLLAAVLAGYVDRALQRRGTKREYNEQATRDRLMETLADRLAPGEFERLTADGAALTAEEARELALGERLVLQTVRQ
ncbi:MAG: hypothetical protein IAI50_11575 [Candidatus Eremiobacteraeota bacterium]|nr:hypothetical protein [Candidatus Eremiobacteraeota bacterium]